MGLHLRSLNFYPTQRTVLPDKNLNTVDFHRSDEKHIFKSLDNKHFLIIDDSI
jgi:hypothetical protein